MEYSVIDIPAKFTKKGKYDELLEQLKSLPEGKAVQVDCPNPDRLYMLARINGLKISVSKISDGVFAVWLRG